MCAAGLAQIHALLPAYTGTGIDPADHGEDRRSLPRGSLQRQPPNGGLPGPGGDPDQP